MYNSYWKAEEVITMNGVARQRKGLYRPSEEHEACGIGMVANIDGKRTHDIIDYAITILCNLEHRGGQSADISTGMVRGF